MPHPSTELDEPAAHPYPDLAALVQAVPDPLVLIDENYRIVAANGAYGTLHGVCPTQIIGERCHAVSHGKDRPCHEYGEACPHQSVFQSQQSQDVFHQHCDGHGGHHRVHIHGEAVPLRSGHYLLAERIRQIEPPQPTTESNAAPALSPNPMGDWMPGESPAFRQALEDIHRAAKTDATILLLGESGAGKEMAACFVHRASPRAAAQMVTIDCTTLTESLFEAELFGHEAGAYTGASRRTLGLVEQAQGGTLFLDEIGELSLNMQAKLLRLLEQHTFRRVGGKQVHQLDIRIVAATNRHLEAAVRAGQFRADLFFRLACVSIEIPSLRERPEDILPLARYFLAKINQTTGKQCCLSASAQAALLAHSFPGNVRELKNRLHRAITLAESAQLDSDHLGLSQNARVLNASANIRPLGMVPSTLPPPSHAAKPHTPPTPSDSLADLEQQQIFRLMQEHGGHRQTVAKALGISERTLYRKLKNQRNPPAAPPPNSGYSADDR